MKKIIIGLLLLPIPAISQVRLSIVDPTQDLVVLKNYTPTFVDISNYRIMSNGVDTPVNKILAFGTLKMKYGEVAVLKDLTLNDTMGNLSLHDTTTLDDDTSLIDFIQWGKSGQQFENTAVGKKYWDSAAYFVGKPPYRNNCWYHSFSCWSFVNPPIIIMRFASVYPLQNRFCIKNAGVSNIDMRYAGICFGNTCLDSLNDPHLSVVSGKYDIPKNDSLVLQLVNMNLDSSKGSIAIFALNKFNKDTTNLLDYVSWGDSLQPYSQLAHIKGIWDSTTTVHLNTAKDSIVYTGDFTRMQTGAQWWQSRTPVYVPGIGISGGCFPGGEVSIYPNPASKSFSIRNEYGKGQATLLDVRGRLLKNIVLNQAEQTVGTDGLSQGIYMLQLTFDSGESRVVKLVIQE